jgi:hypothetical protein
MKTTKIFFILINLKTKKKNFPNRLSAKPSKFKLLVERELESISEFSSDV